MKFPFLLFFISLFAIGQTEFVTAEQFISEKQFVKAEELMIGYVKKHPHDTRGIELLGDAYSYQNKWEDAIANYKTLIALSPKTANFHYKYGGALAMKATSINKIKALGIIGDMKQAFKTAADLDPKHIDTRWALVKLYMELPGIVGGSKSKSLNYADALEHLSKVDGYLAKGYIYEYDKQPDLAEKYYKLAVAEGGSLVCYKKLTDLYINQKQPNKAIATMEAAYDKHKSNILNYQIGSVSAINKVQLEKGEYHLKTYIKNYSPEDGTSKAWANYRLAQIYNLQKKKVDALKYIELAISESFDEKVFKEEKEQILRL